LSNNGQLIRYAAGVFAPFKGKPVERAGKIVRRKTCKSTTPKEAPRDAVDKELGRLPACEHATSRHADQYQEFDR
jgi:hypothetical protein